MHWRRKWQPTPVFLPGKSHGQRSLVGCSPWGHGETDTTERLHFHFSLSCTGEGNGNPLQCSCLENPRDGGAWWAAVYGVAQSRTRLKRLSSSSSSSVKECCVQCKRGFSLCLLLKWRVQVCAPSWIQRKETPPQHSWVFHAHLRISHLEQPSLQRPAKAASFVHFLQNHKLQKGPSMKEQPLSDVKNILLKIAGMCHLRLGSCVCEVHHSFHDSSWSVSLSYRERDREEIAKKVSNFPGKNTSIATGKPMGGFFSEDLEQPIIPSRE